MQEQAVILLIGGCAHVIGISWIFPVNIDTVKVVIFD
jgi:hypothetical protein